jgi:hypothetical protein
MTLPDGVEVWQPKEGSHRIDIVPYEVGRGNPYADPGELYYERTVFVHRGIGPNNAGYVCPAKESGKPCPICEYRGELASDPEADQKLADQLKPKERQIWLVYVHKEPDKGVQLWEFSHWNFGRLLDKRRKRAEEDEDYIKDFDDPEAGATLKVDFDEERGAGYSFLVASSIDFKPRRDGLDEELLDHGICLDELLKVEPYDKLKAVLFQTEEDEPEEEEESPKKRSGRKKPEPKETTADEVGIEKGSQVSLDGMECEVVRVSRDGTSLTLEDEEGETIKAVAVGDVKLLEDEPEEEPPPKKKTPRRKPKEDPPKKKTPRKKKPEPEPDDDDDWPDDDDDWPDD